MRALLVALLWLFLAACIGCTQTSMVSPTPPTLNTINPPMEMGANLTCQHRDEQVIAFVDGGGSKNTIWDVPGTGTPARKVYIQDNGSTRGYVWFDYPDRWCKGALPGLGYMERFCTQPRWPFPCEQ